MYNTFVFCWKIFNCNSVSVSRRSERPSISVKVIFPFNNALSKNKFGENITFNYLLENSPRSASLNARQEKLFSTAFIDFITAIDPCKLNSTTSSPVALLGPIILIKYYFIHFNTKITNKTTSKSCIYQIIVPFDRNALHNSRLLSQIFVT